MNFYFKFQSIRLNGIGCGDLENYTIQYTSSESVHSKHIYCVEECRDTYDVQADPNSNATTYNVSLLAMGMNASITSIGKLGST